MASQPTQSDLQIYQDVLNKGHDLAWAGNWQDAADAYRRAIELKGDESFAHINLGLALYELGDLRGALQSYQNALKLSPDDTVALQKIAEIHARLGEKMLAASTYLLLAESYMKARQPAEAVRAWQQAVRYDPLNRPAYRRLADAYRRGRRNDLAAQATLALARVHAELGEERQARELTEQAIALQPDFAPAQQFLSYLQGPTTGQLQGSGSLRATGTLRRGTGALRRGGTGPLHPTTGPLDFSALEVEEKKEEGPREGGSASPIEAAQQRALARLAEAFFDGESVDLAIEAMKAKAIDLQTRGLVEEAARTYEELLQAGAESSDIYYTLGTLYQSMLRFDEAIRRFERVTDSPDYAIAANFAIGQCYQSQGRADEALNAFRAALDVIDMQAITRDQVDEIIGVFEGLVDSYEAKGDHEQADHFTNMLADYLTSRGWEDKLRELYARLGGMGGEGYTSTELLDSASSDAVLAAMEAARHYQEKGQFRAAIEELYWALPLAPFYLPMHLMMADLFLAEDRPEDAVAKQVAVAEVYLTRSNLTQAIRALKRALEISPMDQTVRGKLIDLLISYGEIDEALGHYIQLAENFYQLAQGDRAVEKLNEALRLAPRGNPDYDWSIKIQRRLADIHVQRLDWRRATAALEAVHAAHPEDLEVVQQLADLYFKTGADQRAIAMIENTADRLYEQQGATGMVQFLEAQLANRPDSPQLIRLVGEMQAAAGDIEAAARSWERVVELLMRKGERAQAAAQLRKIVALHSSQEKRYRAMLNHLMKQ